MAAVYLDIKLYVKYLAKKLYAYLQSGVP